MGDDEARLVRLWQEKRGEVGPEDLSGNLIVQLGSVTENLNRCWYEKNTGHLVADVQRRVFNKVHKWMAATLDGKVTDPGGAGCLRPSSCCPGTSRKKQQPKNTWPSFSIICG